MTFLSSLASSNLAQIILTFSLGFFLYASTYLPSIIQKKSAAAPGSGLITARPSNAIVEKVIFAFAIFSFLVIATSFVFNLGETYNYSRWYKRSFGPLGDGFPFALILCVAFAYMTSSLTLLAISLTTLLLSGGRMAIAAAMITLIFQAYLFRRKAFHGDIWKAALIAVFSYFMLAALSPYVAPSSAPVGGTAMYSNAPEVEILSAAPATIVATDEALSALAPAATAAATAAAAHITSNPLPSTAALGNGACSTVDLCLKTQVQSPIKQRLATAIVGLWMTMQGGFPGPNYPGTAEQFSNFVMERNPWGINDWFSTTRADWFAAKGVQHPYLNFSSGYGPIGLIAILGIFLTTAAVALNQLWTQADRQPYAAFSIFFIVLALLHQSQPWIQSGSINLVLAGIGFAHIWLTQARLLRTRSATT